MMRTYTSLFVCLFFLLAPVTLAQEVAPLSDECEALFLQCADADEPEQCVRDAEEDKGIDCEVMHEEGDHHEEEDMQKEDLCGEAFDFCDREYDEGSDGWRLCVEREQIQKGMHCIGDDERGTVYPLSLPPQGETPPPPFQWIERQNQDSGSTEEYPAFTFDDDDFAHCPDDVIQEAKTRCEASDIEHCVERLLRKKMGEGMCAEGERVGPDASGEDARGCRPFAGDNEVMLQRWIENVRSEHGVDISLPEALSLPVCTGDVMLPGMAGMGMEHMDNGVPMPMGEGMGRMPGTNLSEIFGRAVSILVDLLQREDLPEETQQNVRTTLAWFSDALSHLSEGEDIQSYAEEARQKLQDIMDELHDGGGEMMGGRPSSPPGKHIEYVLSEIDMMMQKIPEAMGMFADMGYAVPDWEARYNALKDKFAQIQQDCSSLAQDDDAAYNDCKAILEDFFNDMHQFEMLVKDTVPQDAMDQVGRELGLDDEGDHQEEQSGMHSQDYRMPPMPMPMSPTGMQHPMDYPQEDFDAAGVRVPEDQRGPAEDCLRTGRPPEECHQERMQQMWEEYMRCRETDDDEACQNKVNEAFIMPDGTPPPPLPPVDGTADF